MTEFNDARSGVLVGLILGGFAAVIFGGVMLSGAIDVLMRFGSAGERLPIPSFIMAGVGFIAFLGFGWSALSSWNRLSSWQRINDRGIMAWGTIGEPRRTNARLNSMNLYDIPLTVAPQQGAPYTIETNWFFPVDLRNVTRPGMRVVVRIDPDDMRTVLVDWDQTRASWGMPPPPQQ